MKRLMALIGLVLVSSSVYADCSGGACISVKIDSMQIESSGIVYIQTTGSETALNCKPEVGVFLKLKANTDGGKNIYSGLLSAQARDQRVDVRIIDNLSPCEVSYVTAY
jgi:hypothetical protein